MIKVNSRLYKIMAWNAQSLYLWAHCVEDAIEYCNVNGYHAVDVASEDEVGRNYDAPYYDDLHMGDVV